jgi:radical SAM superfamily enzyme YgiQ (UPF0313 family)
MKTELPIPLQPKMRRELAAAEHGPGAGHPGGGSLRVALVYPHSYAVGMSSLGFQIALQTLRALDDVSVERFFTDTMHGGALESGALLGEFDIIAFSAAYEMDDPLVLEVLASAGLALEARERSLARVGRYPCPLVVHGGVLISVNRAPLYPFIDAFAHGEAELLLPTLVAAVRAHGLTLAARGDLLAALAQQPGWEVTAGAKAAAGLPLSDAEAALLDAYALDGVDMLPAPPAPERAIMPVITGHPFTSSILTPNTEFNNMALVDLARGCPHHCTFCWVGHAAPAYRTRPLDEILAGIERLQPYTQKFGLVASAVGAHPQIDELCTELMHRGLKVSYSSLRVEEVSDTMLHALAAGGGKSVTIAPEAGAVRVRKLLGKRISDEQIFAVAEKIFSLGAENLKMYFMTGIPSETDDEALEIARFTEKIRALMLKWGRPRGRIGTLGVNLGIFVPKPELPLNHIEPVAFEHVKRRLKLVMKALARIPNTHVNASSPELARAQAVLSMGGIESGRFALAVRQHGYNWRAAVREWDQRHDAEFAWHSTPRLPASRLTRSLLHGAITAK